MTTQSRFAELNLLLEVYESGIDAALYSLRTWARSLTWDELTRIVNDKGYLSSIVRAQLEEVLQDKNLDLQ